MACSAIYFLDMKGKVLMYRNYRGDIENTVIEKFIGWFLQQDQSTNQMLLYLVGGDLPKIREN